MKSLRLTVGMRDDIQASVMKSWVAANPEPEVKVKPLEQLKVQLAFDCYEEVYGDIDFKVLPDEYLHKSHYINVQLPNGNIESLYFKSWDEEGRSSTAYLPSSCDNRVSVVLEENTGPYAKFKKVKAEHKAAQAPHEEWNTKKNDFRYQVRQVLDSVNTTKQLVEAWPEIEEHLPSNIANPSKIQLPVVSIEGLNNQL